MDKFRYCSIKYNYVYIYAVNDLVFTGYFLKYLALNTMMVFDFSRVAQGARCQVALDRAVYCVDGKPSDEFSSILCSLHPYSILFGNQP